MSNAIVESVLHANGPNYLCQQHAPMNNIPVGRPWEMITVDILKVPLSSNNNRYLLVVQDYFAKWVEAVPLPNQTATS